MKLFLRVQAAIVLIAIPCACQSRSARPSTRPIGTVNVRNKPTANTDHVPAVLHFNQNNQD